MTAFFRFLIAAMLMACLGPAFAEPIDPANEPPVPRAAPVVKVLEMALPRPGGILVFGVTRGTGLEVVRALVKGGERVTVMARKGANVEALKSLNVNVVTGDALNRDDVNAAFAAAPFREVLSTLGGTPKDASVDYEGNRNIIDAAKNSGIPRLVLISAIGAGDSAPAAPWYLAMFKTTYFGEKTKAENYLRTSGLEYTIVRPGWLLDAPPSNHAILIADATKFSWITRSDLANLVVTCLKSDANVNKVLTAFDDGRSQLWDVLF